MTVLQGSCGTLEGSSLEAPVLFIHKKNYVVTTTSPTAALKTSLKIAHGHLPVKSVTHTHSLLLYLDLINEYISWQNPNLA